MMRTTPCPAVSTHSPHTRTELRLKTSSVPRVVFFGLRSRRANRATRFSTRSEYNPNRGSSRSTTYYDCGNLFLGRVKAAGSGGGAFVFGLVRVLASRLLAFPQCGRGNAVTDGQGALP